MLSRPGVRDPVRNFFPFTAPCHLSDEPCGGPTALRHVKLAPAVDNSAMAATIVKALGMTAMAVTVPL